jgi:hypothetical protein
MKDFQVRAHKCFVATTPQEETEAWFLGLIGDDHGDTLCVISLGFGMMLSTYHPSKVRLAGGARGIA